MNRKTFLESARSGAAVALGIAGVFGGSFLVTTIVAEAQEQTPAAAPAPPAAPESVTATPPATPAPKADPAPRRADREGPPNRPSFKDFDTNGDGTISQSEFEAFRPTPPPRPPRFEDDRDRYRDAPEARDWRDDRGGPRPPRGRDQYSMNDDRRGPPPPPDDRYRDRRGDDRWGPPPPPDDRYAPRPHGDRGPEAFSDRGGDCDHEGTPQAHRGPRPGDGWGHGPDDRTPPPPPPAPEN